MKLCQAGQASLIAKEMTRIDGHLHFIGYLDTIIKKTVDGEIIMDGSMKIATPTQPDGKLFDFKYDEESDMLGAGTAFLQE